MLSRWPVVVSLPVTGEDRDADGRLTEQAALRLFALARRAYVDRCATLDATTLGLVRSTAQPGRAPAGDEVTVSVNVVEVYPDSFTMTARIRPAGPADGDGVAATAWCELAPGGPVTDAMRDEFIAHAHGAREFH